MLVGLLNGQSIEAFNQEYSKEQKKKWASKDLINCPICNNPYEYCHGEVNAPYFRHKYKTKCDDLYSETETEEHILGKIALYNWIKQQPDITEVKLEGWIPGTKQRPDIMFKKFGIQYVIEYQCSPIATEYYERHDLYKAAGIKDIWVCGTEKYFPSKDKQRRIKTIGKEAGVYFNSKEQIFYLPRYWTDSYGLKRSSHQIQGENTLCELSFDDIEFTDKIEISSNIKNRWIKIKEKREQREKEYKEKYEKTFDILHLFCKENPQYILDAYEDLTIINKSNNNIGIKINILSHNAFIINKKFYKEHYKSWNGKKYANRTKWSCNVTKELILNSDYTELNNEWLLDLCKTYL